jgi:ergosteryl-3beta-O-L-aspartate synthase
MSVLRKLSKHVHPNGGTDTPPKHGEGHQSPVASQSPGPHRRSLAQFLHLGDKTDYTSSDNESEMSDFDSDGMSKNAQKRAIAKQRKHEHRSKLSMDHRDDSEERIKKRLEEAAKTETEDMKARYGDLPLMQSTARDTHKRLDISTITDDMVDKEVVFRCRLHHVRAMGAKLVFLILRQQISTIQGVLVEEPGKVSAIMIHWAEHLRTGNIVLVKGVLQKPQIPVKSASIHNVELKLTELHVVVKRAEPGILSPDLLLDTVRLIHDSSLLRAGG